MNDKKILKEWIDKSSNIVFFGGAGVSTESGIPDFRSVDGLYNQRYKYSPETILSHSFFWENSEEFFQFYKDKMLYLDAEPNAAHKALAELEKRGKLKTVITQNIDGLHQKAGSRKVLELHGSVHRNYCIECGRGFDAEYIKNSDGVAKCSFCGKIVKPDVVLYEEGLSQETMLRATRAIENCDVLIVGGTSLTVYPANTFVSRYSGEKLVLINKTSTPYDDMANLIIRENIGDVLKECVQLD